MIKPQHLKPGDTVAIVSLSRGMLGAPHFLHKLDIAQQRLERHYGLHVVTMPNALRGSQYLYEHPEARAQDLMDAFRAPEIKAVFNAIGGDDTIRTLPYIDFDVLKNNPKIFTGFSDTTVNHMMMFQVGLVSYYGLSVMNNLSEYVEINEYTKEMMEKTLFYPQKTLDIPCSTYTAWESDKIRWKEENRNLRYPRHDNTGYEVLQGRGCVRGELLGGCLDTFIYLIGTPIWPTVEQWRGKLLLLENSEADMPPEVMLWLLRSLAAQGILKVISGIVVGKPGIQGKYEAYKPVLRQAVCTEKGLSALPILYNVNVGHAYPIGVFPLGLEYEIDCEKGALRLMEPATA